MPEQLPQSKFVCPTYSDLGIHPSNLRKPKIQRVTSKVGATDTLKSTHTQFVTTFLEGSGKDNRRVIKTKSNFKR